MIPAAPGVVIETISHQRLNCPGRQTHQALVWVETGFLQCAIFLIENSENLAEEKKKTNFGLAKDMFTWQKKTSAFLCKSQL